MRTKFFPLEGNEIATRWQSIGGKTLVNIILVALKHICGQKVQKVQNRKRHLTTGIPSTLWRCAGSITIIYHRIAVFAICVLSAELNTQQTPPFNRIETCSGSSVFGVRCSMFGIHNSHTQLSSSHQIDCAFLFFCLFCSFV